MGVAHHSAYPGWLEIGRTELLRSFGRTYASLEREGIFLVVTRLEVAYRRPVRYDDLIEVETRVSGGSRVTIAHEYDVRVVERAGVAPAEPEPAAAARTVLARVDRTGHPAPLPEWLVPGAPAARG